MDNTLKVLFVEDRDADVTLARRELERDGLDFAWRRVTTEFALRSALASFAPDIVLCACALVDCSAAAALDLVRLLSPATPFLFVPEAIGEDVAISGLKCGAADYVLKSNLRRLAPAVKHAIAASRERKRVQEIEQSRQRLTEILEASTDMVVMSDADGRITFVNDAACRLLGESRQELLRTGPAVAHPRAPMRPDVMLAAIRNGSWQGEIVIAARDGAAITTSQVITAHKDTDGEIRHFSTIAHDLRDRHAFEARIHQLVHFDTLTGLPNLRHIDDLVRRSIDRARRGNHVIALVILNLDGFRLVDEGYGRTVGDQVLKNVTAELTTAVSEQDTVARVGPDEFLVVLCELADPVHAGVIVQRLIGAIATPCRLAGQDMQITASAGIAVYPNDGSNFETLLRNASAAMHETKKKSQGGLKFNSGNVERRAQRRLRHEAALRNAIEHHELSLHYQPQFEVRGGHACGVEALARWFRADGKVIDPSLFIPLAEQTGLIGALGAWVLQEACATVAAWAVPGERLPTLCVNVSTRQIGPGFASILASALELTGFPAKRLELEITESVLIENADLALECLEQCKRLGVSIAVDDFGTGYSSLSYLSRLPVDRLKLDKSLIHSMTSKVKDAAIVRALISLGRELGFAVIAEGVETEHQFEMLKAMGCRQVQGYLLAVPVCAAEARELLTKRWGMRRTPPPHTAEIATANLYAS